MVIYGFQYFINKNFIRTILAEKYRLLKIEKQGGAFGTFKEETGADRPALRTFDSAGTCRKHRDSYGVAVPVRLWAGACGENHPAAERPCKELRRTVPAAEEGQEKEARRRVQPDVH